MLQCDVEVLAHVGLLAHHVEQLHGELVGVSVVEPDPLHPLDVGHLAHQLGDARVAIEVYAVIGKFLLDDLELADALPNQFPHLVENVLDGA